MRGLRALLKVLFPRPIAKPDVKPIEEFEAPHLRFVAEQDGPAEQELKDKLVTIFAFGGEVDEAYLARIEFGDPAVQSVALCIRLDLGDKRKILNLVEAAFRTLFGAKEHMDIVFLSDEQLGRLKAVCKPFHIRHDHDDRRFDA